MTSTSGFSPRISSLRNVLAPNPPTRKTAYRILASDKYGSCTGTLDLDAIMGSPSVSLKPCLVDLILHQDSNLLGYRVENIEHVLSSTVC